MANVVMSYPWPNDFKMKKMKRKERTSHLRE